MKSKGKKIVIAVVAVIGIIGLKVSGFQYAGPDKFAIFNIEQ